MPRPKNKEELEVLSAKNFVKLMDFVNSFSIEEQHKEFPEGTMNRNVRDVLAHLHHWHLMCLNWYEVGMRGDKPDMPAKGYTWKMSSELNHWIWEKYRDADLNDIKKRFNDSHEKLRKIIEGHTDAELFEKKRYKWTGSTSLGAYLISATSSHYDWALKLIKKAKKN